MQIFCTHVYMHVLRYIYPSSYIHTIIIYIYIPTSHLYPIHIHPPTELSLRGWGAAEKAKRRTLQKEDIEAAIKTTDIFDFLVGLPTPSSSS